MDKSKINNLNKFRLQKDITQSELADRANTSIQTIKKIEIHEQLPRVDLALRLAEILNTTVEKLFKN